jgi:hypothetical protein
MPLDIGFRMFILLVLLRILAVVGMSAPKPADMSRRASHQNDAEDQPNSRAAEYYITTPASPAAEELG